MSGIFAGTFSFLAMLNGGDAHPAACLAASNRIQVQLVTTAWALTEVADAFAASMTRRWIKAFVNKPTTNPKVTVVLPTPELFQRGLDLPGRRPDKDRSLTDCISFVVMADEGLTEALTGDHHFGPAGFRALLA